MKVSVNWIRDLNRRYQCSAEPMPDGIDKLVEKIGAQLGAVDEVTDLSKKYDGIVAAKIISCEKHPNADKLSICLIDDGGVVKGVKRDKDGYVQVVCGAPNAKTALAVAWIPPGVVVPSTADKDPLVLEARDIRGVTSNGMLASPKELALGDSHEGILVIDEKNKPGQPFAEIYGLDDYIIDIENKMFTHRPDLFGILGIARELAGIQGMVFRSPKWYREDSGILPDGRNNSLKLAVKNKEPDLVPRFCMAAIKDVTVAASPVWLQTKLSRVGIRPINNIVDLTNLLMHETAQPLHAYDYDKVKALSTGDAEIQVRLSKAGEELTLLGGRRLKLKKATIVIATDKRPIGLGGVMGGAETEVDDSTKNIILEVGTFDMNLTRKTAMDYGIQTDAVTRFTKGQSPLQNMAVLSKAADDIKHLAGGRLDGEVHDIHQKLPRPVAVKTSADFINSRLGLSLTAPQIKKLLENVEFEVKADGKKLNITAPFWRTDIEIPEDIVEEVGRLYGYDHLPRELPKKSIKPANDDPMLSLKDHLRQCLSSAGANEVLSYSFVHESLIENSGQNKKLAYHLRNALSPDLQYYRLSLTPSLLEKVHPNIKAGINTFSIFELGRAHVKGVLDADRLPAELQRLSIVTASKHKPAGAPYYWAKRYLENLLLNELSITGIKYVPLREANDLPVEWRQAAGAFEPKRSAVLYIDKTLLGLVGEPTAKIRNSLKLPANTAQIEVDIEQLEQSSSARAVYTPLNRFPSIEQDITLRVNSTLSYEEISSYVFSSAESIGRSHGYQASWQPLDIYQKDQNDRHKNVTWRLTLAHPERTLTIDESNKFLDELVSLTREKFEAERI